MRALTSRDHHRDTRKAFVRHDMHTPSRQSVARHRKLDPQIDSDSSMRLVISGVAEVDCAFLRKMCRRIFRSLMQSSKLRRRLAREFFENTIELRQRLKPDGERDLADTQIRIQQEITGFFESDACDVIDKIYAGDLLELFAQMIRADIDRFRYLRQRKLFGRMLLDETSRLPDLHRFGSSRIP